MNGSQSSPRPRAFILAACDPASDPRIGWFATTLSARYDTTEIGLFRDGAAGREPSIERLANGRDRVRAPDTPWPSYVPQDDRGALYADNAGWTTLAAFAYEAAQIEDGGFFSGSAFAADPAHHERRVQMRRILRTNASLIRAARALGPADLLVAADFDALPAAVVLKQDFGARLLYDAHEFWPYAFPQFDKADEDLWVRIERRLAQAADARFTVSPQLAGRMADTYGVPFISLPNAAPIADSPTPPPRKVKAGDTVEFLFLGGFAPGRGLKLLIEAWPQTPANCMLALQGPDAPYKSDLIAMARARGLLGSRIRFPPPTSEAVLIARAAMADVGLVPYEPTLVNHQFCSPNKVSQYMAAGLPILANQTEFVAETIKDAGCGVVIDFSKPGAIADAVAALAKDGALRRRLGDRGRAAFEQKFNWEAFSPAIMVAAGEPPARGAPPPEQPEVALHRAFAAQTAKSRRNQAEPAPWRAIKSAGRFAMRLAWHGVPFLRLIVLSSARLRQRAEHLREL